MNEKRRGEREPKEEGIGKELGEKEDKMRKVQQ